MSAHTVSDAYLVLPDDGVVFLGDLGFFQSQPFMGDCSPKGWVDQLSELERLPFDILVPGHRPTGTRTDLALQRQYIFVLEAMVAESVERGGNAEQVLAQELAPPLGAWQHGGVRRFAANVRAAYRRQTHSTSA
jgi:glyoxylase-like metal-dependent hydrolase (beta-lactamase superfamily II)